MNIAQHDCCLIFTTIGDYAKAKDISRILLSDNLAKCIQIDKVESCFKWNSEICSQEEFRILIKAKSSNYKAIEDKISSLHNYQVPQIIKCNVSDGLESYIQWINQ
ncbi:MAG: divalent-cation tolerance protein CutA [Rickettsiaceae bacterium]